MNIPKIIYVSNTDWYLYNFRLSFLKEMIRRGWDVVAAAPRSSYKEKLEKEGVRFYSVKMDRKGKNPFKDLSLVWELFRLYKRERPDIVHHFTIKPVIYGSIAARLAGNMSVVNAVTGLGYAFMREGGLKKFTEILYRLSFKNSGLAIFQNREDLEYFLRKGLAKAEKAFLIEGSGVDVDDFSPVKPQKNFSSDRIVFLMTSRMLWDKGVREYIESAQKVRENFPDAVFWLAGGIDQGNPSSIPRDWIEKVTNQDHIKWWGHLDDIKSLIAEVDVVVLPSYREGLPKNLLEAASMEKPIITTDIPGCRDVVAEGENGFLVPVKDVEKLADAMIDMIKMKPSERAEMGKQGRKKVIQRFSDNIVISKTLEVYKKTGCFASKENNLIREIKK